MQDSAQIRVERGGYTVLYNSVLRDDQLSLKTKGLFAIMQSLPPEWDYSVAGLSSIAHIGRDAVRKCLLELQNAGYLLREQEHDGAGKFSATVYVLQQMKMPEPVGNQPLTENQSTDGSPVTEKPSTEKPSTDFQPELSKDLIKQRLDINIPPIVPQMGRRDRSVPAWNPERFEAFWEFYRKNVRPEDRAGAVREWNRLKPDDLTIDRIGRALKVQIRSEDWRRGIGIPHARTYLHNRRWEDVSPGARPQASATVSESEAVTYF